jgi:hypothetical protein
MTTQEKLGRIRTRCTELLALAEKRTPREWKVCHGKHGTIIRLSKAAVGEPMDVCRAWNCSRKDGNANFIAACSGNAEAGWRATIAAIASLGEIHAPNFDTGALCPCIKCNALQGTLNAWPDELL